MTSLYQAGQICRTVFSRRATWRTFCVVVLGLLGARPMDGVASWWRFWHLEPSGSVAFLPLLRSSAWSLTAWLSCWWSLGLSQPHPVMVAGHAVLLGDHPMTAQDGRRMPGVVPLHQDRATHSTPHDCRGHVWGAMGLLSGTVAAPFCCPLSLRIPQGCTPLRQPDTPDQNPETSATRLGQMALDFAVEQGQRCRRVWEAFCSVAAGFTLADSVWSVACQAPLVPMLVRAQKRSVASCPAERPAHPGPRRPRQDGDKVTRDEVFDSRQLLEHTPCQGSGALEDVASWAVHLRWTPTGGFIRFLCALTSRGPLVFRSRALQMSPVTAIAV
jgi:hypothetical protein